MWSLLFCIILLSFRKQLKSTLAIFRDRRTFALLVLTSLFLTVNWGVYIWSVTINRIVEASLGYFITPLISVTFGILGFRERLRPLQWMAVALAAVGVVTLTVEYGAIPFIALTLAISWSSYSLFKKSLKVGALEGLSVETTVALIPSLFYLIWLSEHSRGHFGTGLGISLLLAGAGIITVVPLLLFNGATTRLPLSTTGLLQYITPGIMFLVGIFINHESMPLERALGFGLIWLALAFLGTDLVRSSRSADELD